MKWRLRELPALRWWGWAIVAGLVIGVVLGLTASHKLNGAPYVSSSQVLVTGRFSDSQVDSALSAEQYVDQRMSTYAEIATSEQVTGPAARVLGTDSDTVAGEVSATVEGDTTVISLAVQGGTPRQARTNAAAVTRSFTAAITTVETIGGGTSSRVELSVISQPTTPPDRDLPGLALWIVGGVIVCVGLALLIGLLLRWLFPKWQNAQREADVVDAPVPHDPVIVRRAGSLGQDATAHTAPESVDNLVPPADPEPRQVARTEPAPGASVKAPRAPRRPARKPAEGVRTPGGEAVRPAGGEPGRDRNGPPTIEIPQTARRGG